MPGSRPRVPERETALARVFAAHENLGHAGPSTAWNSFTATWNWAAPLPAATPARRSGAAPTARPAPGGFSLSGLWHLPPETEDAPWLLLPLTDAYRDRTGGAEGPDLFVVPTKVLSSPHHGPRTLASSPTSGSWVRVYEQYVPAGFTTFASGTPLRPQDGAFLWTAVTAMALGAARRLTEVLASVHANGTRSAVHRVTAAAAPAATAAELATRLSRERYSLHCPDEPLTTRVRQTSRLAHHVVATAHAHASTVTDTGDRHRIESLLAESNTLLQHVRFTLELLPPHEPAPVPQ